MNKEESILDDETLFFGYFQATISGPIAVGIEDAANGAEHAIKEHRKRFPRRIK